jgi:hypothetical protein
MMTEIVEEKANELRQKKGEIVMNNDTCKKVKLQLLEMQKTIAAKEAIVADAYHKNENTVRQSVQLKYADAADPIDKIKEQQLINELGICNTEYSILNKKQNRTKSIANQKEKVDCLLSENKQLEEIITQMLAIENEYPNNIAKANMQKQLLYFKSAKYIATCH